MFARVCAKAMRSVSSDTCRAGTPGSCGRVIQTSSSALAWTEATSLCGSGVSLEEFVMNGGVPHDPVQRRDEDALQQRAAPLERLARRLHVLALEPPSAPGQRRPKRFAAEARG